MTKDAAMPGKGDRRTDLWPAILLFAALLVVRVLAIHLSYFFEEDELAIAAGSATLVRNAIGGFYRYTVQLGYYRLIEGLDLLLGGRILLIPVIMKVLSAVAGAAIPVMGWFAFRDQLARRERWLVALMLAINPIVWRSSQYGNSGMVATALATFALVVLSNRPRTAMRVLSLAVFGAAVLVRADTVVLAPLVLFLLKHGLGSWKRAIGWSVACGIVMLGVYALIFAVDPRIDNPFRDLSTHMNNSENQTLFWEFLVWSMSPIPLLFAIAGMRGMLDRRPWLLAMVLLWCVPTMLFYFRATTTPRYFLNVAVPLSVAAAVGIYEVAQRLREWIGARSAYAAVIALASVHLLVAMGRFTSDGLGRPAYGASMPSHDGPMPTGALLYMTFHSRSVVARMLPHPRFGVSAGLNWEPVAFGRAIPLLADTMAPHRTVVMLLAGGWNQGIHFHAHAAGAHYVSREPSAYPYASEIWFELGNARVMTIGRWSEHYPALKRFDVAPGDEFWVFGRDPFPDSASVAKMPAGLEAVRDSSFHEQIRVFKVRSTQGEAS